MLRKSTLAKAIKKAKGDDQDTILQASFVDDNNNSLILSETEKAHIFVFDEEYVDKNVKFRESGLDTIIMLGQQAEIEEQIKDARMVLEKAKENRDAQNSIVNEYDNVDSDKSPKHFIRELRWALQGDDCWSGRDKQIKGNRQNTGVRDDTYKQFVSVSTTKSRDQLIVERMESVNQFGRIEGDLLSAIRHLLWFASAVIPIPHLRHLIRRGKDVIISP